MIVKNCRVKDIFTGHEHLDEQQLIHMNGRIYDYNLGRFLSVDPLIHGEGNSQGINPYSYVLNNPLSGTDPTGYEPKQGEGTSNPCKQGDDRGCGPHEGGDGEDTVNDGNGEENSNQGDQQDTRLTQQERRQIARCVQNKGGCDAAVKIIKDKLKDSSNNKNKKIDDPNGKKNNTGDQGSSSSSFNISLPSLPQGVVDFSAGLGDALLFGVGDNLRNSLGVDGGVDRTSGEYFAGEISSFAAGGARLLYASGAKVVSLLGRSIGGLKGAEFAISARNGLKVFFRGGLFPNFRNYPASRIIDKYGVEGAISAAGRTNNTLNATGAMLLTRKQNISDIIRA